MLYPLYMPSTLVENNNRTFIRSYDALPIFNCPRSRIVAILAKVSIKPTSENRSNPTDKRDQWLENALAKSRADRLARANVPGDRLQFSTPVALKPHDEANTPASREYPRDPSERVLDYIFLHPRAPGDPHQRSG